MERNVSMLDEAEICLKEANGALSFADLYEQVTKVLSMSEEEMKARIGKFYTDLTMDGRFVALTDNHWDLRERHTYEKVHIDVNDVYSDVEESESDAEDLQEEKEFDAEIKGETLPEDDELEGEEESENKGIDEDVASLVG